MRPSGMRPTTPPCDARTIFGRAVCRVSESWTVWQGEGFFFDEYESWFQILHVHFGIGACEDACFAVGERDLREVVVVGE